MLGVAYTMNKLNDPNSPLYTTKWITVIISPEGIELSFPHETKNEAITDALNLVENNTPDHSIHIEHYVRSKDDNYSDVYSATGVLQHRIYH
ncbi:hypothetical protein LIS04_150 [Listeria phage LIS04]|nr:hypothetical protein LIS04_150 [Listeria phage LIS04]